MAIIKASDKHREEMKRFETFQPKPYDDGVGNITQGYGHKGKISDYMDEAQASALFDQDVQAVEEEASRLITRDDLTQGQQDVIVDMLFNVRRKALDDAKIFERINNGEFESVYESLGKYTKARDLKKGSPTYGQLVELPGLVKRSQYRQSLWGNPAQIAAEAGADFNALAMLGESGPEPQYPEEQEVVQPAADFNELALMGEAPAEPPAPTDIDVSRIMAKDIDPAQQSQINMISKTYKVSKDEADIILKEGKEKGVGFSDLMLMGKGLQDDIEDTHSGVKRWASNPNNYPLLKQDPEWAIAVDNNARSLKDAKDWFSDFGDGFWYNYYDFRIPTIHAQIAKGTLPMAQGIEEIRTLTEARNRHPIKNYMEGTQALKRGMNSLTTRAGRSMQLIESAWTWDDFDSDRIIPSILATYVAASDSFYGLMDLADALRQNPGALALMTWQNMGQALTPMAIGAGGGIVGGAAGSVFGPYGTIVGAYLGRTILGALAGGTTAYGQYMQERLEEFVDGSTNEVDWYRYFSDPKRVEEDSKKATKYAIAMGAAEGFSSFLVGRGAGKIQKAIADSKVGVGVLGKTAKVGVAIAKTAAVEPLTEGAGEFAGRIAAGEAPQQALEQAVEEAVIAGPSGIVHTAIGYGSQKILDRATNKEVTSKVVDKATEAGKALSNYDKLKTARAIRESSEISKQNPDQTKELFDTAENEYTTRPEDLEDTDISEIPNEDAAPDEAFKQEDDIINQEARRIENKIISTREDNSVNINAEEWDAFFEEKGLSPLDILQGFDEATVQEYVRAKEEGGDFSMPMSDFLAMSEEEPGLDEIARVGDAEYNVREAGELIALLEDNAPDLLIRKGKDGEEPPKFMLEEGEPGPQDPVLRPIQLQSRFRSPEQKQVYDKIKRDITRGVKGTQTDNPEVIDFISEVQYRHIRQRAEVLGRPMEDVINDLKVERRDLENARGAHTHEYDNVGVLARKILFDKDATPNTVVHEFAHAWLYELMQDWDFIHGIDEANLTPAQREYKEAMTLTAELFNTDSLGEELAVFRKFKKGTPEYAKAKARWVRVHETFAQTSEKYFLEGKFENIKMRQLFETMRKWMKKFQNLVAKAYPHFPPFKIDPKIERIFSILTAASNTVDDTMGAMFPPPAFDEAVLGTKAQDYLETHSKARDEALGEMYHGIFKRSVKENERLVDQNLNRIFDEATEAIDDRPSMRIMRAFQGLPAEQRISFKSFADTFFNGDEKTASEAKKEIPRAFVAGKKKAGITVSEAMSSLELSNSDQFLELMREAGKREDIILEEANRRIDREFNPFKSDEEIHQIAVEALHKKGREKLLRKEMEILANRYLGTLKKLNKAVGMPASIINNMAKETIRAQAMKIVANTPVARFRLQRILKQSQRYGRQALEQFYTKNDILEAFRKKQQEIVYFTAYQQALGISKRISKSAAEIKRVRTAKLRKISNRYDYDIYAFGKKVIQQIESGRPISFFDVNRFPPSVNIDNEFLNRVNTLIGAINMNARGKRLDQLNVGSYVAVGDLVSMIRIAARHSKVANIKGKQEVIEAVGKAIAAEVGGRKPGDPNEAIEMAGMHFNFGIYRPASINYRTLISSLMTSEEQFAKSILLNSTHKPAVDAQAKFTLEKNKVMNTLKDSMRKVAKKDKGLQAVFKPLTKLAPKSLRPIEAIHSKELNVSFEKGIGQVIMAILHSGSESGRRKLLLGGINGSGPLVGLDQNGNLDFKPFEDFINRLIDEGTLRQEHFDFINTVWGLFAEYHQPAKAGIKYTHGYEIGTIQPSEIKTKLGTLKGGYIPAVKDTSFSDLLESIHDFSIDDQAFKMQDFFPTSDMGFTKERTEGLYELSLSLEHLPAHFHRVLQAAYLKPIMLDVGKILNNDQVRTAIETRVPGAYEDIIKPWFNRVMAQHYTVRAGTDSEGKRYLQSMDAFAHLLRKRQRTYAFMFNGMSALKQSLGLLPAAKVVKPKYLLRAMWKAKTETISPYIILKKAGLKNFNEEISIVSERMRVRFEEGQKRAAFGMDQLEINGAWVDWTSDKIDWMTYLMIQGAQNRVDTIVWLAAKEQAYDMNMNESEAITYADDVVERTQFSTDLSTRPDILHKSEARKLITDFLSININNYGLIYESVAREADAGKAKRIAKGMQALFLVAMIPAMVETMLAQLAAPGGDEEDEDDFIEDFAINQLDSIMGTMWPVYGTAASNLVIKGRGLESVLPATRGLTSVRRSATAARQYLQGVSLTPWQIRDMNNTATLLLGVPLLSPVTIPLRMVEIAETPKEKKKRLKIRRRQLRKVRLQEERDKRRKERGR